MHRPSAEKLWHMPQATAFPILPPAPLLSAPLLSAPLLVHATSYFALSAKIFSLSKTSMAASFHFKIEH
jgi:hypothetical protein